MDGNIVQLLSALASQLSTALGVLGLLHQTQLGELLKNVSVDLSRTNSEVVGPATKSLRSSEDLSKSTNSNVRPDVNPSSNGGGSGVQPVGVIRSELLEGGSLDDINPLEYFDIEIRIESIPLGSQTCLESSSVWHMPQ